MLIFQHDKQFAVEGVGHTDIASIERLKAAFIDSDYRIRDSSTKSSVSVPDTPMPLENGDRNISPTFDLPTNTTRRFGCKSFKRVRFALDN